MNRVLLFVMTAVLTVAGGRAIAQWTGDSKTNTAIAVTLLEQSHPSICPDGKGGAFVVWQDNRANGQTDIYAQRISASGAVKWGKNGIIVCNANDYQGLPQAYADTSGGAYFLWLDGRKANGGNDSDVYVQHVDSNGKALAGWPALDAKQGLPVCADSAMQHNFVVTSDGQGGIYVAWEDSRTCFKYDTTYKDKIGGWPPHKIGVDTNVKCNPNAQASSNTTPRVFMQHIDYDGIKWAKNGIATCDSVHKYAQINPLVVPDHNGGVHVIWMERQSGQTSIYSQNITAAGGLNYVNTGKVICTFASTKNNPCASADSSGGFYVAWEDGRVLATNGWEIYGQHLSGGGTVLWSVDGDTICRYAQDQFMPQVVTDTAGNAFFVWQDHRNLPSATYGSDLYAQHINGITGKPMWKAGGLALVNQVGDQNGQMLFGDKLNGFYMAWSDYRAGGSNPNIYSLRFHDDATPNWSASATGLPTCTAADIQDDLAACISADRMLMVWRDARTATDAGGDVYAQIVYPDGTLPVELASFTASVLPSPGHVRLAWNTASEVNTVGFEIWRQRDADVFARLAGFDGSSTLVARGSASSGASYVYEDDHASGATCSYKLVAVDNDGSRREFGPVVVRLATPTTMTLDPNYPNPFSGLSVVGYALPAAGDVTVRLTDLLGREIARTVYPAQSAGWHSHTLDGTSLAPGTYVLEVASTGVSLRQRVTVAR